MGIESDQVVFEYLSRVGDVAQQRQLPSATRMRLVSELRNEIDRHRAKTTVDSPAAVRRILDRLGDPADIVTAAGGASGVRQQAAPSPTAVPEQRDTGPRDAARRKGRRSPAPETPAAPPAASPPHLASARNWGTSATDSRTGGASTTAPSPVGVSATACPGSSAASRSRSC